MTCLNAGLAAAGREEVVCVCVGVRVCTVHYSPCSYRGCAARADFEATSIIDRLVGRSARHAIASDQDSRKILLAWLSSMR